jgi:prepilin-type N-terminal cleavage/methylation domain-containing protein
MQLRHRLIAHTALGSNGAPVRSARQAGVTLIELLVVMGILLVIMGAVYGVWMGLTRTYAFTEEDVSTQTQSRAAMAEMVEYIRTARQPLSVTTEGYDTVIPEAGPFSLTLWTDTNRDGSHTLQLIRFRVNPDPQASHPSGTKFELLREQGDASTCSFAGAIPVRLVSSNVANDSGAFPLFSYLDALGQPTDDPVQIRQVVINLRIDVDPTRSPVVNVLHSVVQPRNLRQ